MRRLDCLIWRASWTDMSSSSYATVASPPTGGCSPPSSGAEDEDRSAFAGAGALTREQMLGAQVRSPKPSRLRKPLKRSGKLGAALEELGLDTVGELLE